MFVAASTRCFADLPLDAALQRLVDLEYTCVEIMIHEAEGHMKPSEVLADLDAAVRVCRQTHRLTPIAFSVDMTVPDSDPLYYDQFAACCRLAKASKVVTITVRSAELGTPYNAEVERLRKLSAIASLEGVRQIAQALLAGQIAMAIDEQHHVAASCADGDVAGSTGEPLRVSQQADVPVRGRELLHD